MIPILSKYCLVIFLVVTLFGCKNNSKDTPLNKTDAAPTTVEPNTDDAVEYEGKTAVTDYDSTELETEEEIRFVNGMLIASSYDGRDVEGHQLFLAATKLCWNYDYKDVFGEYRKGNRKNGKERIKIDNCCAGLIPSPYVSPLEYYYSLYHDDREIMNYQDNVFELRGIRENLVSEKYESFEELVQSMDTENIISYSLTRSTIQSYDFDTGQLSIRYYINKNQRIGRSGTNAKVASFGNRYSSSFDYLIDMTEGQAKDIYDHYANFDEYNSRKNPPFELITKTTYSLAIPDMERRPYSFKVMLKKIEFFKQSNGYPSESDKIGQLKFIDSSKQNKNSLQPITK